MAGKKKPGAGDVRAEPYLHKGETRKNNPDAGMVDYEPKGRSRSKEYCWDPRESPQLIWAGKAGMKRVEVQDENALAATRTTIDPSLKPPADDRLLIYVREARSHAPVPQ